MITVCHAGAHTLIQDLGRAGHYAMGLPPSGAIDQFSHRCANLLVGNDPNAATLEITMIGPTLEFAASARVAVTGGDVPIWIDGEAHDSWRTLAVRAGQTLTVGALHTGCRAYLAVRGGIDCPPFLGSRSTYVSSAIGGLSGSALAAGDRLPIGSDSATPCPGVGSTVDNHLRPRLEEDVHRVRVVEGLCHYRFDPDSVDVFFSSTFTVSPVSDRTGYRLIGPALEFFDREPPFGAGDNPSNVVDLGYPMGSIQVPNGEEPICLLRDAVTGGGYATIGTVITSDLDLIGQMKAPDAIQFTPVSLDDALSARRAQRQRLRKVEFGIRLLELF